MSEIKEKSVWKIFVNLQNFMEKKLIISLV